MCKMALSPTDIQVPNGDAAQPQAEEAARLTAEREALVQQVRHLEQQLAEAASRASQSTEQYQMLQNSYQEEARQKEEQRQIAISYQEHCNNLTKQVETLREACQSLACSHSRGFYRCHVEGPHCKDISGISPRTTSRKLGWRVRSLSSCE